MVHACAAVLRLPDGWETGGARGSSDPTMKRYDAAMNVTLPIDDIAHAVQGAKVGLLTNGCFWVEQVGDDLAGLLKRSSRELVVLYAEHGPLGCEVGGEPASKGIHPYLGCEVRRLAALAEEPHPAILGDLELVVIGMPDIGVRHYTYKGAASHAMKMAAQVGRPLVVVDFPNPIGGRVVEGNVPDPDYYPSLKRRGIKRWFWFDAPLTYRYGMTMGELCLMCKDHLGLDLDLRVIKLQGWQRGMYWQDTGWPFIPLDPTIYTPETTMAFSCTGLFQGTSVSWGIGTADPFRVIGAPWIEDDRLLQALRRHDLPGVTWTRAHFLPRWSGEKNVWGRYAYQVCNGVRLHFIDCSAVRTAEVQLTLMTEMFRLYPDQFKFVPYDPTGSDPHEDHWPTDHRLEDEQWADRLAGGEGVETILSEWQEASRRFVEVREPYLLY